MRPAVDPGADAFQRDGLRLFAQGAASALDALESVLLGATPDAAGVRLSGVPGMAALLAPGSAIGAIAGQLIGEAARPVRALLFDKGPATNWALGWHQDRVIVVAERHAVPGFGPWTVKQGLVHVAPPFALLASMVTVRVHLDPVDSDNAPLLVAPGSHRARASEGDVAAVVASCGSFACLAARGDVWAYATPILHASEAARRPRHRRVLQVDYAACDLPPPLRWLGV